MNKLALLSATAVAFGVGRFLANPPVDLQPTTPGTQQSGNINVSGTVMAGTFYGSSGGTTTKVVSGWATSPTGFVFGGDFRTNSVDGRGLFASALAKTGSTYGGDFRSASTTGRGIFGYATSTTGQAIGGDFRSDASSGTGIVGRVTSTTGSCVGGLFSSDSSSGTGIKVSCPSTTGFTIGGVFDISSSDPNSSAGVFRSNGASPAGTALTCLLTATNSTSTRCALFDGRAGYGVYANALTTGGFGVAAHGEAKGVNASAVSGIGVRSTTDSNNSYGVYGMAPAGGTGAAIYADGVLAASGTKTMRIDHPDDPENKYLLQYCAEGDTPQLQYRGVAKLDASGNATIALPSYFDKINRDPSYQLTAVGAPMPNLYVSQKVTNNQFKISGGKPGAEVSWTVIGIRNDRFVQAYGAKTEVDKPKEFRGTYLRPELYNQKRELTEGYNPKDDPETQKAEPQAAQMSRQRSRR